MSTSETTPPAASLPKIKTKLEQAIDDREIAVRKIEKAVGVPLDPRSVPLALKTAREADDVAGRLALLNIRDEVPQDLLRGIKSLQDLAARLKTLADLAGDLLHAHFRGGSVFKDGAIIITSKTSPGRSYPEWKAEAIALAAAAAAALQRPFSEERYVGEIQDKYPVKQSLVVKTAYKEMAQAQV